ncbi:MAG: DUF1549 domain-containing protein [Planctomycetota bacterium]|nr:DUF1549 domain-containing protein [Planctomycetota bacterium]
MRCSIFDITLLLVVSSVTALAEPPRIGNDELKTFTTIPAQVVLVGQDDQQQLVVTGHHANSGVSDVTHQVSFKAADAGIVRIDAGGLVAPVADGTTSIAIESQGVSLSIPVRVTSCNADQPINFTNEIVPILTKLGCNAGSCHGKAEGQNGFKLSLLGFDPAADYEALVHEGRGRRVLESAPEQSLLLIKPTGRLGHGGGKPLAVGSADYRLLERWIAVGSPFGNADDPRVTGIEVRPAHRLLRKQADQQLTVTARYSDGKTRDVTRRAEFRSNDGELIDVNQDGRVQTVGRFGEGSVMVRYAGFVSLFRATIPLESASSLESQASPANFIDEFVFAKHRQLGYVASELCTDGEFIRRASLDIAGTLPLPDEVRQFVADQNPNKRQLLVDRLLERPEYAEYWSLKWADVLRVRGGSNDDTKAKIDGLNTRAIKFREWIRQSLAENKRYDRFVREIVTADGMTTGPQSQPAILWYLELKNAEGLIEDTSQAFLGTRIQCARCHHHPFEKWSQDDYWGLAGFYARVEWRVGVDRSGKPVKDGKPIRASESGRVGQLVAMNPNGALEDSRGRVFANPSALDAAPLSVPKSEDPREKLVDWMVEPTNPFFARALVNRYWGHFFARGIVEPVDDMRETNPASNPELLDGLAASFLSGGFDLKALIRSICHSHTYQLSSLPNSTNRQDLKHCSRYLPRRLPAEVLYDAIDLITDNKTTFRVAGENTKVELEIRAIQRPHMRVSNYFLETFGINKRDSACECGRESDVTLAQRVLLLNNGDVQRKLSSKAEKLLADKRPLAEIIDETYLACFARLPNDKERQTCVDHVSAKLADERKKTEAFNDLLWALVNSKEFIFQR